jgi:hypothetical protein
MDKTTIIRTVQANHPETFLRRAPMIEEFPGMNPTAARHTALPRWRHHFSTDAIKGARPCVFAHRKTEQRNSVRPRANDEPTPSTSRRMFLCRFSARGPRFEIMLGMLVVVFCPDDIAGLSLSLG